MRKESLDQLYQIFREEAQEHLAALERGFLDLEAAASVEARTPIVHEMFRRAHSFKGAARAVGLAPLQAAGQMLEDTLEGLRRDPARPDRPTIDLALAQLDAARRVFEAWRRGEPAPPPVSPADGSGGGIRETGEMGGTPTSSGLPAAASGSEERFTVRVSSDRLDRMLTLAGEVRVVHRAVEAGAERLTALGALLDDVLEHARRLETKIRRTGPAEKSAAPPAAVEGIRRQLEGGLDQLRRTAAHLAQRRARQDILLETLEGEIQQARLLPLAVLADTLRRTVRDLAQSLGKTVRYEVEVGDILLDKAVIEALKDPLLQLVRNAIDHGIEPPEERRAAGKPAEGRILVRAERAGNRVRIAVADDGRGVDFARVRERVRRASNLDETQAAALTEAELGRVLFQPGFTTAPSADAVSGRGVGLDVVRNTVHRLQGASTLESTSRSGTTFVLQVPVTISTVRILTVTAGSHAYGIPTDAIHRTGAARADALRELEGAPVLPVDGEPVPWIPLADLLGEPTPRRADAGRPCPYVLVGREGRRRAVSVETLDEESEVILKPLGFPLEGLRGVVGGTIRPDGSVQLVLDLPGTASRSDPARRLPPRPEPAPPRRVLVVDDSPTTRTFLRGVLAAAGYVVDTAVDGVDALERLGTHPVHLVVSDLDMPRMDGIELTRRIKAGPGIPVILVTGMEKEEDRREGLRAGADAYVVKSTFEGEGLLEIVKQLI